MVSKYRFYICSRKKRHVADVYTMLTHRVKSRAKGDAPLKPQTSATLAERQSRIGSGGAIPEHLLPPSHSDGFTL